MEEAAYKNETRAHTKKNVTNLKLWLLYFHWLID